MPEEKIIRPLEDVFLEKQAVTIKMRSDSSVDMIAKERLMLLTEIRDLLQDIRDK